MPSPKLTMKVMTITPALARQWLGYNTHNRTIKPHQVARLALAMTEGRFRLTGESIKRTLDGLILDGQHRLLACVESGVSFECLVIEGLPADIQDVLDSGVMRNAADALFLNGFSNTSALGAMARLAFLWENDLLYVDRKKQKVDNDVIKEFVTINQVELELAMALTSKVKSRIDLAPSVIGTAVYICQSVDPNAAEVFFQSLAYGTGLEDKDPILALASRLRQLRIERQREEQVGLLALTIRGWNHWRLGHKIASLPLKKAGVAIACPYPV